MSSRPDPLLAASKQWVPLFAALGDETRLDLLARLGERPHQSIRQLTEGSRLTRQAITKHLRVLQGVGVVAETRAGREARFELQGKPLSDMSAFLAAASRHWDHTLARLKAFAESSG